MYVSVEDKRVQNMKSEGHSEEGNLVAMVGEVVSNMEADVLYIIDPGTTP